MKPGASGGGERSLACLFVQPPGQWGLRGDPYLWKEMQSLLADSPWPDSASVLRKVIETAFERLTGHPISTNTFIGVERYPRHGMSGGMVAPEFWNETVIPLLIQRYSAADE